VLTRHTLQRTARLLLGALLLAQAALAAAACEWGAREAARAVAMAAGAENPLCHEAAAPSAESGLCLTHCLGDQQSLDKPSVAVPAPVRFMVRAATPVAPPVPWRERPLAASAPPPRILFQSFLI